MVKWMIAAAVLWLFFSALVLLFTRSAHRPTDDALDSAARKLDEEL